MINGTLLNKQQNAYETQSLSVPQFNPMFEIYVSI